MDCAWCRAVLANLADLCLSDFGLLEAPRINVGTFQALANGSACGVWGTRWQKGGYVWLGLSGVNGLLWNF